MKKVFNKLVRDNIPKIIESNNEHPLIRYLDDESFDVALIKKY